MVRPIVIVTDCLQKCLVYCGGGKESQFINVNYHIQSRHGIMIICPTAGLIKDRYLAGTLNSTVLHGWPIEPMAR